MLFHETAVDLEYHDEVLAACPNISPTPYRISTITGTGDLGVTLDLDSFFTFLPLTNVPPPPTKKSSAAERAPSWGIYSVQYYDPLAPLPSRSILFRTALGEDGRPLPAQRSLRRKRRQLKHFENQVTIIYWEQERLDVGLRRGSNIKCFRNGRLQMAGLRSWEEGSRIMERLAELLKQSPSMLAKVQEKSELVPEARDYRICLINTDFKLNVPLRRDRLFDVFVREANLICSYEPCVYPGVKVSFMWNHAKTAQGLAQDGCCSCLGSGASTPCKPGKEPGSGFGPGQCKAITCLIFQTGSIIITGACTQLQIEDVYRRICSLISVNLDVVSRIAR